ncbi:MAG: hypothetical protein WCC99_22170, partial [Candidatus Sulfotelmatobacter sp.]
VLQQANRSAGSAAPPKILNVRWVLHANRDLKLEGKRRGDGQLQRSFTSFRMTTHWWDERM